MKDWFKVSTDGLKELQLGKPKHYVLREFIQNVFDENSTKCIVMTKQNGNAIEASIEDDNPTGFVNLDDAFTLFNKTYKRKNPEKRGRFCMGEKMSFSICDKAMLETTKGTIIFDNDGRHEVNRHRISGSKITIWFKSSKKEYDDMLSFIANYLPPKGIIFEVNHKKIEYVEPSFIVEDTLPTQNEIDGQLRDTQRKTMIHIHKRDINFLYELGIPVVEIDCDYSIDVQQKIPMSVDRESVKPSYLKQVYAIVLNNVIDDVQDDKSSESWIRIGSGAKQMLADTMQKLVNKRFGDKVVVANPRDPIANDDAIAHGFRVIQGRELSADEWGNIKEHSLIRSSTEVFGKGTATDVKEYAPDENMKKVAKMAQKFASEFFKIKIDVNFFTSKQANVTAMYGDRRLSFNITKLGKGFFENMNEEQISLIIHELGHEKGMHTEDSYHQALTALSAHLIITALNNPEFFKEGT